MDEHPTNIEEVDDAGGWDAEWTLGDPEVPGYRCHLGGKGTHGTRNRFAKELGSWWRDGYTRSKSCHRVVSHVFSTAMKWQRQLAVERCHVDEGVPVGDENPASNFQTQNERRRKLGRVHEEDVTNNASEMEETGPADDGREEHQKIWENDGLGNLRRGRFRGWRTTAWWRNRSAWSMKADPAKHKFVFHNRDVGNPCDKVGGER